MEANSVSGRRSALLTVRRGLEVIHVHTERMASRYLFEASGSCGTSKCSVGLGAALAVGAAEVLEALVGAFPLDGKATKSLSTALRARMVRTALSSDEEMMCNLEYIAKGADAFRHLTPSLIKKTVAELQQYLNDHPHAPCVCTGAEPEEEELPVMWNGVHSDKSKEKEVDDSALGAASVDTFFIGDSVCCGVQTDHTACLMDVATQTLSTGGGECESDNSFVPATSLAELGQWHKKHVYELLAKKKFHAQRFRKHKRLLAKAKCSVLPALASDFGVVSGEGLAVPLPAAGLASPITTSADSESESGFTPKADEEVHVADVAAGVGPLAALSAVPVEQACAALSCEWRSADMDSLRALLCVAIGASSNVGAGSSCGDGSSGSGCDLGGKEMLGGVSALEANGVHFRVPLSLCTAVLAATRKLAMPMVSARLWGFNASDRALIRMACEFRKAGNADVLCGLDFDQQQLAVGILGRFLLEASR